MKNIPVKHDKHFNMRLALYVLLAIIGGLLITACGTTYAKIEHKTGASWSGNVRNSGIVAAVHGGGFVVDQSYVSAYDGLVSLYGAGVRGHPVMPAIQPRAGVTANYKWQADKFYMFDRTWVPGSAVRAMDYPSVLYYIDNEHTTAFLDMNQWRANGLVPYGASSSKK